MSDMRLGRHRADMAKQIAVAKIRVKDPDSSRVLEAEMVETSEYLDINAALAMSDMLLVSPHPATLKQQHATLFPMAHVQIVMWHLFSLRLRLPSYSHLPLLVNIQSVCKELATLCSGVTCASRL